MFFFSSRRRHTRCALVTGVQTCALPIYFALDQITSIEFTSGWAFGEISIFTSGHKTTINRLAAAETRPFVEAVRKLTSPISSGPLPSLSHANLAHFERVGSSQPPEPAEIGRAHV